MNRPSGVGALATVLALLASAAAAAAPSASDVPARAAVAAREWRRANERRIIEAYSEFLRLANVSRDLPAVRRNADHLLRLMKSRGIRTRVLAVPGAAPVVYGELLVPGARHTYVFYAHYDGQPVNPQDWATPPFEPTLRTARIDKGGRVIPLPGPGRAFDPEWRLYARSSADDKAQIFAILTALDGLRAAGLSPRANLKFVFDGEEEIGSPNLPRILKAHRTLLKGDLWLFCDGPEHSSGRPTITFGARGVQSLEITVYGAHRELHSGHYGGWAPNPAFLLAGLLASMVDEEGRSRVKGFEDGMVPLSEAERRAIAEIPDEDAALKRDFGLARAGAAGERLELRINRPALNVRGLSSAKVGDQAANVIPASATASIDLRLVEGIPRRRQVERVLSHIRAQGYHVVTREPDAATRLAHSRIARVVASESGYDAVRTPMTLPAAQRVIAAVRSARGAVVLQPTMGGSIPLAMIREILGSPAIILPVVNHDNNQHSSNENIRIGHFWNGIETQAALLMMD